MGSTGRFIIGFQQTVGSRELPSPGSLPYHVPNVVTAHWGSYNGMGDCNFVGPCSLVDTGEPLFGEYAYDCSNLYCGDNAIRHCGGVVETVPCTGGLVSSPEIVELAEVKCLKERLALETNNPQASAICSQCERTQNEGEPFIDHGFSCDDRACAGCLPDGEECIFIRSSRTFFYQSFVATEICRVLTNTGDTWCFTTYLDALIIHSDGSFTPNQAACGLTWNGEACSCSICGFDSNGNPATQVDRSDAVGSEAFYDDCSGIYAGAFAFFGVPLDPDAACPSEFIVPEAEGDSEETSTIPLPTGPGSQPATDEKPIEPPPTNPLGIDNRWTPLPANTSTANNSTADNSTVYDFSNTSTEESDQNAILLDVDGDELESEAPPEDNGDKVLPGGAGTRSPVPADGSTTAKGETPEAEVPTPHQSSSPSFQLKRSFTLCALALFVEFCW